MLVSSSRFAGIMVARWSISPQSLSPSGRHFILMMKRSIFYLIYYHFHHFDCIIPYCLIFILFYQYSSPLHLITPTFCFWPHLYFIVNYFGSCGIEWKVQWLPAGLPVRSFLLRISSGTRFCWNEYLSFPLLFYRSENEVGKKERIEGIHDYVGIVLSLFTSMC